MRALRPTTSRDDIDRVTVRLSVRLSHDDLVSILTRRGLTYGTGDLAMGEVLATIRDHMTGELYDLTGRPAGPEAEDAAEWAAGHVARIWPESNTPRTGAGDRITTV